MKDSASSFCEVDPAQNCRLDEIQLQSAAVLKIQWKIFGSYPPKCDTRICDKSNHTAVDYVHRCVSRETHNKQKYSVPQDVNAKFSLGLRKAYNSRGRRSLYTRDGKFRATVESAGTEWGVNLRCTFAQQKIPLFTGLRENVAASVYKEINRLLGSTYRLYFKASFAVLPMQSEVRLRILFSICGQKLIIEFI